MNLATFEDHLDRYGGELGSWPETARREGAALVATSTAARRALDAMRAVEQHLASPVLASGVATERADAVDAMASAAMRHPQRRPSRRLAVPVGWGAAAAAVLVLGLAVGTVAPRPHDESPERVMAAALEPSGSIDAD